MRIEPLLVTAAVIGSINFASSVDLIPRNQVPPVSQMAASLLLDVQTTMFWRHVFATLSAWAIGLMIVLATAVPAGLILGSSRPLFGLTSSTIELLRPIPTVALLPLLLTVYGPGRNLAVSLVVLTAFWPLLIQTIAGVRDVDPVLHDTARVFRLSWKDRIRQITLPSALPYIATGLRISAVFGLLAAITASLIGAGDGIGYLVLVAELSGATDLMWARIIMAGFLGLLITVAFVTLEKRALKWHPSQASR